MRTDAKLFDTVTLPCGEEIPNRFMKSAMSEILGSWDHAPSGELRRVYSRWAEGGAGLLVTGNVMIDKKALGEPANVVIENRDNMAALKQWADAGKKNGTKIFVQLNHPGKQSPRNLSPGPVAPSAIPLGKGLEKFFATPVALEEKEIQAIIDRFATAAAIVKEAGFSGVQIHAAHGYLVSQFLSPLHNVRTDHWGGNVDNRMRFLIEIYQAMRDKVGPGFPIAVKINTADFRKGGFSEEEALAVIKALDNKGIDLIELSGGSYESPVMTGRKMVSDKEAYFLDIADRIIKEINAPVAVTGGFRTAEAMKKAVQEGKTDFIGLARPLAVDPDLPNRIRNNESYQSPVQPLTTGIKWLDRMAMLEITWYEYQIGRLAKGQDPRPDENVWLSMIKLFMREGMLRFRRRRA